MGLCYVLGNDAAIQIAVSIAGSVEEFANLMNKKAQDLGLNNTHFVTPHGLDEKEHYTTAYELAIIADYALNIDKIAQVIRTREYIVNINNNSKTIRNTNELLGYLNGVNGVKTGFTNGAGRCLVTSVNRNNFNIITVVLGADTKKIRTKDSINLIEYIYSNYELVDLKKIVKEEFYNWSKINKNRIHVYKGVSNNVHIELGECKYNVYPIKKDRIKDVEVQINNFETYLEAPINKGMKIGDVVLKVGDEEVTNIKIIINESIERKGIKEYMLELLNGVI